MIRPIKFRAWDMIDQVMVPWSYFRNEQNMDDMFSKELLLMQYTGLKDKNGTEIYEGDIILDQSEMPYEVYYDMGQFLLKHKLANSPISLYMEPITEVIGNIYEDPELLQSA